MGARAGPRNLNSSLSSAGCNQSLNNQSTRRVSQCESFVTFVFPFFYNAATGLRVQANETFDVLLDAEVALTHRVKLSETLRQPSGYALVQDKYSGYGINLMGFREMAERDLPLKPGTTVNYIGKSGNFKGQEKFVAIRPLDFDFTITSNVMTVPAAAETEEERTAGFGEDNVGSRTGLDEVL